MFGLMKRGERAGICILLLSVRIAGADVTELKTLYQAHKWAELRDAVGSQKRPPVYRGIVAAVYGDDRRAEPILKAVIRSGPQSDDAYEAYEWLTHIYLRTGQYRQLIANMEARWAAFPKKSELITEQNVMAGFRGLPDQTVSKPRRTTLPHEAGEIFIPVTINKLPSTYFFDTGAWLNCMSESEARRLGLTIHDAGGTLSQAAGARIGFRTAVAPELTVGDIHFRNVSFAVFRDDQEPWSDLAVGRRGLIGIPILLGLKTLRWSQDGTVEIGAKQGALREERTNLFFDDDHLAIVGNLGSGRILATLDTGAEGTDLYEGFAKTFTALMDGGKKDTTEVRGVGHADNFESITLDEVKLGVGGTDVVLRPAHVLMKQLGARCCVGNFGMDLFKQGRAFRIDFGAMRFELER
jgi:gag-polyprotein putative aspartyl protease